MRLDVEEQKAICTTVRTFFSGSGVLYLYGSRSDDTKRGGDIDLLLIVNSEQDKNGVNNQIHYLLTDIKEEIGDQRIDFSVLTDKCLKNDLFYQNILPNALILARWE